MEKEAVPRARGDQGAVLALPKPEQEGRKFAMVGEMRKNRAAGGLKGPFS